MFAIVDLSLSFRPEVKITLENLFPRTAQRSNTTKTGARTGAQAVTLRDNRAFTVHTAPSVNAGRGPSCAHNVHGNHTHARRVRWTFTPAFTYYFTTPSHLVGRRRAPLQPSARGHGIHGSTRALRTQHVMARFQTERTGTWLTRADQSKMGGGHLRQSTFRKISRGLGVQID